MYKIPIYRQFKKNRCERCKYKAEFANELHVHHKNHRHNDNQIENLETLCELCHIKHHKGKGGINLRKKFDLRWLATFYSKAGGNQQINSPKKGILDYFVS